jgi:GNAT superfamily N-acetyltransferase
MAPRTFEVGRMQRAERPAVVGALARAFYDDPLFGFFVPHHVRQTATLLTFMSSGITDAAPFDEIWVARTVGKIAATAAWLPPGAYPRGFRRDAMSYVRAVPVFTRVGRRLGASVRLLTEADKAHHELQEPHYYLAILGTDPLFQRAGAGSAVLRPVLERCDEQGLPAYLETQKEENVVYYARHGFEVVKRLDVRGCPPVWTLLRRPR